MISFLEDLLAKLQKESSLQKKIAILNSLPETDKYLTKHPHIQSFINSSETEFAVKSIIAIGQAPILFNMTHSSENSNQLFNEMITHLLDLERFYPELGGIIGYHLTLLKRIHHIQNQQLSKNTKYLHPEGFKLDQKNEAILSAVRWGIENLPHIAEIYPVGGSGDRLNLTDPATGVPLPAALLAFAGRTLLEGLIRDHQAREYLYFKLFGKKIVSPIVMMTSSEKNNHKHILDICRKHEWFGRSEESFFFFTQPQVPVITVEGNWSLAAPLTLTLKPGGHGVIWKLAEETGAFKWLLSQGYDKSLVRQINNPIAGIDNTIFALLGLGIKNEKALGFVSCERIVNSAEGTNILIEKEVDEGFEYCLTNIEYTDFAERHVDDAPSKPGSPYSTFPANTNILFVDIRAIKNAIKSTPFPGQLINLKNQFPFIDAQGNRKTIEGGRLETTMQNIADSFVDRVPERLNQEQLQSILKTFIVTNQRTKTISTTKKTYHPGESPLSTPEQAFYDMLVNCHHLLEEHCHFKAPSLGTLEEYLKMGPEFIFIYHPALGPLYSVISQKLRRGRIEKGSELQMEIAEVDISDLHLNGSLIIEASSPMDGESRCALHRVKVNNKGIDREATAYYWKNQYVRKEQMRIYLHEGSEFEAVDVTFEGSVEYEVPPDHKMTVYCDKEGRLVEKLEKISGATWSWQYTFDKINEIKLTIARQK